MIATGLTFLFGVLVTLLFVLLIAPIIWRKAQRLARRDYEATIPASANEIRAEFDTVRAAAALTIRQHEIAASQAREKVARSQAQLGRNTVENVEIIKRNRSLLEKAEANAVEIARLSSVLETRDDENQTLSKSLATTQREAELRGQELSALAARFEALGEIAEERKIQLVAAEAKLDQIADAQRVAERTLREQKATIERLNTEGTRLEKTVARDKAALAEVNERVATLIGDLAGRDAEIDRLTQRAPRSSSDPSTRTNGGAAVATVAAAVQPPAPAVDGHQAEIQSAGQRLRAALAGKADMPAHEARADIQERISDIAARMIHMTAEAEGPQSPLAQMLGAPRSGAAPAAAEDGRGPSLAERVRRLAQAEPDKASSARGAQPAGARRK